MASPRKSSYTSNNDNDMDTTNSINNGTSNRESESSPSSSSASTLTPAGAGDTTMTSGHNNSDAISAGTSQQQQDQGEDNPTPSTSRGDTVNNEQEQAKQPEVVLSYNIEDYTHPSLSSHHDLKHSYKWDTLLNGPEFVAAPVPAFLHAPMASCWDHMTIGIKVEIENKDLDPPPEPFQPCYWIASILRFSGYYALLRFEGFGQDGTRDFWVNIASDKVHPVGWCATKGKPLIPPATIMHKYADFKDFVVKRLTGARTMPTNFYAKIWQQVSSLFRPGMKLEVVDKTRICQVRVATIKDMTGRRLYLQYDDFDGDDDGFWCHQQSPLIHPVGWAKRVGHQVVADQEYFDRCALENFESTDCTSSFFPEYRQPPGTFQVGMKIEAVDPLNLASICVATVMKVLRFGYIMIRIDGCENDETGSDWFCYHGSSPLIFPPGFCSKNGITIKPPAGFEDNFEWMSYLKATNSQAAPFTLFHPRDDVKHPFRVGMKLEAADQMDPRLICVSTVVKVVGRLLKIHFDGWEEDYDQWMDCHNVDIYPVGWANLVGHKLEGPRQALPQKKEKKKPQGRESKKRTSAGSNSSNASTSGHSNAINSSNATNNPAASITGPVTPNSSNKSGAGNVSTKKSQQPPQQQQPLHKRTSPSPSSRTPPPPILEPQTTPSSSSSITKLSSTSSPGTATANVPTEASSVSVTTANVAPQLPVLKAIPRLIDSAGQAASAFRGRDVNLDPASWNVEEVAQFLEINECSTLVDSFTEMAVDGNRFLSLAKEDIMKLVNNKIGPCLKVENLLSLLKARMNPAQARYMATIRKNN